MVLRASIATMIVLPDRVAKVFRLIAPRGSLEGELVSTHSTSSSGKWPSSLVSAKSQDSSADSVVDTLLGTSFDSSRAFALSLRWRVVIVVFQLLVCEEEALLFRGNAFLSLNLCLHCRNCVRTRYIQRNRLILLD